MLQRVSFISVVASMVALAASCSSVGENGFSEPPPKGSNATDAGSDSDAEADASSPPPSGPAAPGTTPNHNEPASPAGGSGGSGASAATAGAPGSGGSGTVVPPNYGEAVVIDDGVVHVWTLGDSITVGVEGGFRNDVYNLLTSDGWKVDMVGTQFDDSAEIEDKDHEGHTAYTFQLVQEDVDGWLSNIHTPDVVLMMLGSNDFAWWTNEQPAQHMTYCMGLIDHVLAQLPAAGLIVATLPPQSPEIVEDVHRDRGEMVDEFNELVRAQLPAHELYGKRLFLADVRSKLDLSELYDGIHPTREAHREVADSWYEVLTQILPAQ